MSLISREELLKRFDNIPTINGLSTEPVVTLRDAKEIIKAVPEVDDVPLDKLCEWLADSAYMYLTEKELDDGYSSHDPVYWEMKLKDWMEAQDA